MIVTADWHLGLTSDSIYKDGLPSKLTDTLKLAGEMIRVAAKEKDRTLVIAGDLFDSTNPKSYVVAELFKKFREAQKLHVKVYLLPGNHDCGIQWSSLILAEGANYPNVTVITAPTSLEGIDFLPHLPKVAEEPFLRDFESYGAFFRGTKSKILIGHAHKEGSVTSSEAEIEAGNAIVYDPREFPSTYSLVILGHIHQHQELPIIVGKKKYSIVYPGSPIMCNFGEVRSTKGYLRVGMLGGEFWTDWEFIPFKSKVHEYKQIKLDLLHKDTLDLSPEKIKRIAKGKMLKIVVYARDSLQVEEAKIRKAFNEFGRVFRFEYAVQHKDRERLEAEEIIFTGLSHVDLLQEYLKGKTDLTIEEKRRAMRIGEGIIAKCFDE